MKIKQHIIKDVQLAELERDGFKIESFSDGLDVMANAGGARKVIIYKEQMMPEFFDLSTGIAGEILQKFVTYGVQIAIVGDFSEYTSQSFKDFIFECNNGNSIFFVSSFDEATEYLTR
ncbi:MAG: DUF4180 domain-containing protein [Patescibacteria group bacterium]|nr:DUF4180 domain-containing protein [Patescibacteria group bacterium]